jgi:murein DD-endopeptidase MepM/ murein hydrolase activator NlpD
VNGGTRHAAPADPRAPFAPFAPFERWTIVAYALLALGIALALYLAARPGGRGPIALYRHGPLALSAAVLAVGAWAAVHGLRHRPFLARRRVAPLAALAVTIGAASFPLPYPSSFAGRTPLAIELPARGTWRVRWGGRRFSENALVLQPDRCFGFDLEAADGATLGAEVLAPCAGRVAALRGDVVDGDPARIDAPYGNFVALDVGAGSYLFLCGLACGSIAVSVGEPVHVGSALGRIGHSSPSRVSPEPHLAVHLMSSDEPGWGEGCPLELLGLERPGGELARDARGPPDRGTLLTSRQP